VPGGWRPPTPLPIPLTKYHPNWREISERYDDICNDMDALLALAGAPGSDS
jgi:hypothetical protein